MSIVNLIKTALYSIRAHKLRVFLTMIGIIIGISSVVTIMSIGDGMKVFVNSAMQDTNANKYSITYESNNKNASTSLNANLLEYFNKSDIAEIQNMNEIKKAEQSQDMGGISFAGSDASYFGTNAYIFLDAYSDINKEVQYGRFFLKGEEDKNYIVLSNETAKQLFNKSKDAVGRAVTMKNSNYEVIGVLPKETGFLSFGHSYVSAKNKSLLTESDYIGGIDIYLESGTEIDSVFKKVKKRLEDNHPNLDGKYKLQDPQEITKAYEGIIGSLTAFITAITGISLFVGGIGVMNIMYVSVTERKREIGIRRAIGAKPLSILLQFLFEAMIVTGIGGIIGIFLGYLFANIVGIFLPFKPVVTPTSFIGASATSVIVGIIFGIIPAKNAAKLDPIKAIYQ